MSVPVLSVTVEGDQPDRNLHTNWCFTFNYGKDGQPDYDDAGTFLRSMSEKCRFIIAGREVAPSTGQKHWQGYCQMLKRCRLSSLKKVRNGGTVHFEPARGSVDQNIEYCTKTENCEIFRHGEPQCDDPGDRERARWKKARDAAVKGDFDNVPDQIYVSHYSSIRSIARDHAEPLKNEDGTTGLWYYGLTGTGKSRTARSKYGEKADELYLKPVNKWWDGYRGQPYVLLEDFGKEHAVLGYHLKIWGDRYSFPAEIKGSTIQLRPKKIIVTSQYHPRDIWAGDPETLHAILRRYELMYVGDPDENPWEAHLVLPSEENKCPNAHVQNVGKGGLLEHETTQLI